MSARGAAAGDDVEDRPGPGVPARVRAHRGHGVHHHRPLGADIAEALRLGKCTHRDLDAPTGELLGPGGIAEGARDGDPVAPEGARQVGAHVAETDDDDGRGRGGIGHAASIARRRAGRTRTHPGPKS